MASILETVAKQLFDHCKLATARELNRLTYTDGIHALHFEAKDDESLVIIAAGSLDGEEFTFEMASKTSGVNTDALFNTFSTNGMVDDNVLDRVSVHLMTNLTPIGIGEQ